MADLIKADLYRVLKDKLFIVLCIIAAGLALVMCLLNFAMMYLIVQEGLVIRTATSALTLALSAFGPFTDYGLVLAILVCILLMKDISYGTIRNKIIMGKSRLEIFVSNMIVSVTVVCGLVLGYSFLTFSFGCIFFQPVMPDTNVGQVVLQFLFALIGWIAMAMAIGFFTTVMKNAGLAIVCYVIIGMVLYYAGTICASVSSSLLLTAEQMETTPDYNLINTLNTISTMLVPYQLSSFGGGGLLGTGGSGDVTIWTAVEYLPMCVAIGGGSFGFGYLAFRHKDIK